MCASDFSHKLLLEIRQEHDRLAITGVEHLLCGDEDRVVSRSAFDHQLQAYRCALPFSESKRSEVKRRSLAESYPAAVGLGKNVAGAVEHPPVNDDPALLCDINYVSTGGLPLCER